MIEEKKFYIAPEVEIICFAPVENVATDSWGWAPFSLKSGDTGQVNPSGYGDIEGTVTPDPDDEIDEGEA